MAEEKSAPTARPAESWLEFCDRMRREHGRDGAAGAHDARAEIERDGWTRDTARAYLASVGAAFSPYARGYDAAVQWFAEVSCGRAPASGALTPPAIVCSEVLPDGSGALRLSFGIKVF